MVEKSPRFARSKERSARRTWFFNFSEPQNQVSASKMSSEVERLFKRWARALLARGHAHQRTEPDRSRERLWSHPHARRAVHSSQRRSPNRHVELIELRDGQHVITKWRCCRRHFCAQTVPGKTDTASATQHEPLSPRRAARAGLDTYAMTIRYTNDFVFECVERTVSNL